MSNVQLNQPIADLHFATTENPEASFLELKGKKIVLYFYPKDSTPGCTLESKDFRDFEKEFTKAGTCIFGISRDSLKSHHKFKEECELPFPLVSDNERVLCNYFNVLKEKNMYGKKVIGVERSTFLIDEKGVLRQEWRNVKVPGHVEAVLEAVRGL